MYRKLGHKIKKAFRRNRVMKVLVDALGSGPFDGGCLVVAKALIRLFPELKIVTMILNHYGENIPAHYAVMCPDGGIIDGDGYAPSPEAFIKRFIKNESICDVTFDCYRIEPKMIRDRGSWDRTKTPNDPRAVRDLVRELRIAISTF
jgi:hypothetical protein